MKITFITILFVVATLFSSCNPSSNSNLIAESEIDSLSVLKSNEFKRKIGSDTIFLQFVLGSSIKETEAHIKGLLKKQKIYPKMKMKVSFDGNPFEWEGYLYNLYSKEDELDLPTQIVPSFVNDKLYEISIYSVHIQFREQVKNFLQRIYGKPTESNEFDYWTSEDKEIMLSKGYNLIQFSNITLRDEKMRENNLSDSVENKKQENKDSKRDFE